MYVRVFFLFILFHINNLRKKNILFVWYFNSIYLKDLGKTTGLLLPDGLNKQIVK